MQGWRQQRLVRWQMVVRLRLRETPMHSEGVGRRRSLTSSARLRKVEMAAELAVVVVVVAAAAAAVVVVVAVVAVVVAVAAELAGAIAGGSFLSQGPLRE